MGKYIFILSENDDVSVDSVMDWLYYYNRYRVVRINTEDRLKFINISMTNVETRFSIILNGSITIDSAEIHAYWYRRGELKYNNIYYSGMLSGSIDIGANISKYYGMELSHTIDTLHYLLKHLGIITINSFSDIFTNKLINLEVAKSCGLNIPDTIVSNQADVIASFLSRYPRCITKPIRYPGHFLKHNDQVVHYAQRTNLVNEDSLSDLLTRPVTFQPTLFQEYIDKEFEIRTFFLEGKFFSMAIFSQQNEKTKIDFRNYDDDMPNRNIRYSLPAFIEEQLCEFSARIGINCGSVDLMVKDEQYYFLEINPVGQFQWLSHNCYYQVEREIAKHLIDN